VEMRCPEVKSSFFGDTIQILKITSRWHIRASQPRFSPVQWAYCYPLSLVWEYIICSRTQLSTFSYGNETGLAVRDASATETGGPSFACEGWVIAPRATAFLHPLPPPNHPRRHSDAVRISELAIAPASVLAQVPALQPMVVHYRLLARQILKMGAPQRPLRVAQVICVLFTTTCFLVAHSVIHVTERPLSIEQGLVVLLALWTAGSGFSLQHKLTHVRVGSGQPPASSRSTPAARWRVGNLMRLATATSVGLWALILHVIGGSSLLVDLLFGLGLALLLIWSPGPSPDVPIEP
jgi:hypothetical protein